MNINNQASSIEDPSGTLITSDMSCSYKMSNGWRIQKMLSENQLLSRELQQNLVNSWQDLTKILYFRSINLFTNIKNWMSETHCGLAKLVGVKLISAQYKYIYEDNLHSPAESQKIINSISQTEHPDGYLTKKISMNYGTVTLNGVICYPSDWDPTQNSNCILFHNQNRITISEFFTDGKLATTAEDNQDGLPTETPGNIQKLKKWPIILYDYRGTGINKASGVWYYTPTATAETAIEDGITALHYTLTHFNGNITILGSSMGGGIATVSLASYLDATENPETISNRITLINHDSFTTTSSVIIPRWPNLANAIGSFVKANIDAQEAMQCLSKRSIRVIVLAHENDDIISKQARLINFLPKSLNIFCFTSTRTGHANLSCDQLAIINNIENKVIHMVNDV